MHVYYKYQNYKTRHIPRHAGHVMCDLICCDTPPANVIGRIVASL